MTVAARFCTILLFVLYTSAALADLLAPYSPEEQHRDHAWSPPASLRWAGGGLVVQQGGTQTRLQWFPHSRSGFRLFGPAEDERVFLIGSDGLGRDQFSRLLYGARLSLFSGLAAALLSAVLGIVLGGIAGFLGGFADRALMALAEIFLALPWMYLLLAARAFFPLNTAPELLFASLLFLLGFIGWARPARLVRGVVLSTKERDYVVAARGFGAGPIYLLFRHALPPAYPVILTYLGVAIPHYIAAEATLSFIGLGFSGSTPSLGGLISNLTSLEVLGSYWWMWIPAGVLALVLACYSVLTNSLREIDR